MPVRRTNHQRKISTAQQQLEVEVQKIVQAELEFVWQHVKRKIKRLHQQQHLQKVTFTQADLWTLFRDRLRSKLLDALLSGALMLHQLQTTKLTDAPVEFDTTTFARNLEEAVGERITKIELALKRKVGKKIVGWYNSPNVTTQDLVNQLKDDFGLDRATLIARTEITSLDDKVQTQLARQLGISEWWWGTKRDQLVCIGKLKGPDGLTYKGCRELHGKRFTMDQPGPPEGSHIGCILPGQEVAVPELSAAVKSFYKGRVVNILTVSGRRLSVTPNHPVLTDKGYIAAEFIHVGDNVVTHSAPERIVSCTNPDYKHIPSVVENVFNSFRVTPGVTSERMPASSKDFHGDGRGIYDNVNVIWAHRKLTVAYNSSFSEHINKIKLNLRSMRLAFITRLRMCYLFFYGCFSSFSRRMSILNLVQSLLLSHIRPFKFFRFVLSSDVDLINYKYFSDDSSTSVKSHSGLFFRYSRLITGDNFVRWPMLITHFSKRNVVLNHSGLKASETNVKLAADFCVRDAAFIKCDKVTSVSTTEYSGHVYDLQSDIYSLYTCNGIIVSNCRCKKHLVYRPQKSVGSDEPIVSTDHLK